MKYSVIVPHYNSAVKLGRLVASIPDRNDIEVVVVDDMSDSGQVEMIQGNSALMSRARVLFPGRKLTAGGARNMGLRQANGEWLLFADADDFFEPGAFDILDRELAESKGAVDVFYFKVRGFREFDLSESARGIRFNRILDNFGKYSSFNHVVPWAKLVRHQLIKDCSIAFEEVRFSNDLMFTAKLALASDAVKVIDKILYHLEEGSGGLTSRKSEEDSFCRREVQLRHEKFLFQHLPDEFLQQHRYVFYRKYLRDSAKFRSKRLQSLRHEYEMAAGISPLNLFRLRYGFFLHLRRLGLSQKIIGSGPGAPYWACE
jgi:glycosyltransferase involved in cell wall biosynthesis